MKQKTNKNNNRVLGLQALVTLASLPFHLNGCASQSEEQLSEEQLVSTIMDETINIVQELEDNEFSYQVFNNGNFRVVKTATGGLGLDKESPGGFGYYIHIVDCGQDGFSSGDKVSITPYLLGGGKQIGAFEFRKKERFSSDKYYTDSFDEEKTFREQKTFHLENLLRLIENTSLGK